MAYLKSQNAPRVIVWTYKQTMLRYRLRFTGGKNSWAWSASLV